MQIMIDGNVQNFKIRESHFVCGVSYMYLTDGIKEYRGFIQLDSEETRELSRKLAPETKRRKTNKCG